VLVEHTGAVSNDKNPRCCRDHPADHALGRSRGGLSAKSHAAVDGRDRPLAILLTLARPVTLAREQQPQRAHVGAYGGKVTSTNERGRSNPASLDTTPTGLGRRRPVHRQRALGLYARTRRKGPAGLEGTI
jgi:hypothetical protein